jgi:hypothetical protein
VKNLEETETNNPEVKIYAKSGCAKCGDTCPETWPISDKAF